MTDEALREQLLNHPRVATTNYADIPNYQQLITIPLQDLMQLIKARDEQREREILEVLKARDSLEARLDSFAEAVACCFDTDIGEHSSENDPWYNAFKLLRENTNPNQQTGEK